MMQGLTVVWLIKCKLWIQLLVGFSTIDSILQLQMVGGAVRRHATQL